MNKHFLSFFKLHDLSTPERLAVLCIHNTRGAGITYEQLADVMGITKDRACRIAWGLRDRGLVFIPVVYKEARLIKMSDDAQADLARTWQDYVDVADQPDVNTALQNFAEDSTEENATYIIQAVEQYL